MFDEDQDTLAAEYVLGTLSAEERAHAESLLSFDPGFEAAVRQWERRLGELNVMVEAVEPPTELWDKIKNDVIPHAPAVAAAAPMPALPAAEEHAADEHGPPHDHDASSPVAAITADLLTLEQAAALPPHDEASAPTDFAAVLPPPLHEVPDEAAPSADVIDMAKRVRRWRG